MWCGVVLCCFVWCGAAWPPCLERTHGGVLNLHTEVFHLLFSLLLHLVSSFLFHLLSLLHILSSLLSSLFSLLSSLSSLLSPLSSLLSSLFSLLSFSFSFSSLSVTMTLITRSVGPLCTHGSDLPECQCAWASVHSLFGEHVRIMHEKTVPT